MIVGRFNVKKDASGEYKGNAWNGIREENGYLLERPFLEKSCILDLKIVDIHCKAVNNLWLFEK